MKYKIGIIGATQSVDRIISVSHEFKDGIEFLAFPFEQEGDIPLILQKNKKRVDGWLFAGPLAYNIAQQHFHNDDNVTYCKSVGAGFYINCLQIAQEHSTSKPLISVDMYDTVMNIENVAQETNIPLKNFFIKYYNTDYDLEKIVQFHHKLWLENKTDGAITASREVFNSLKKAKVPVYYLSLTKLEISQSLKYITEKVKTSYFKTTQVGSVIILINKYEDLIEKSKSIFALQTLEWKLKGLLLPLCNSLDGHLSEKGNGVYEIFSTRGAIDQNLEILRDTLRKVSIEINFDVTVSAGVGFGDTVSNAEFNAYRALKNLDERRDNELIIIRDDGGIVEATHDDQKISYDFQSYDQELLNKLHTASVGIKTYRKIEAVVASLKSDTFTVVQLATQLAVTEQNIRRILGALCQAELVEVVGEEAGTTRGRPGKIYKLK